MTDKQIIINGVDVRKCVNRRWDNSQKIHLCYDSDTPLTSWGWCENNPNCYYKQLKRKERECKNNKIAHQMELDIYNQECLNLQEELKESLEQLDQLKAENDELTTINARLLGRLEVDETDTSLVFNLDKELRQKEKEFYTAIQKVVKLKQTITEIKEIAEKHTKLYYADFKNALILILQKISECKGNDETN